MPDMPNLESLLQQLSLTAPTVPTWIWLLALAGCMLLWNGLRSRRRLRQMQRELERVRNDMRAMTTAAVGVGGKVREIERRQRQIKQPEVIVKTVKEKPAAPKPEKVVTIRPAVEDYAAHPYDYAIQLARQGSSVNEIMYQSGIGQHEAKLIHMLHAVSQAS